MQRSFSDLEYAAKKKLTRRDRFLAEIDQLGRQREKLEVLKASVRAKVEHPFHVLKNLFRHRKTRYRGLAKNTAQLFSLFAFANLVLAGRRFKLPNARGPSRA
eukprot:gene24884-28129_t